MIKYIVHSSKFFVVVDMKNQKIAPEPQTVISLLASDMGGPIDDELYVVVAKPVPVTPEANELSPTIPPSTRPFDFNQALEWITKVYSNLDARGWPSTEACRKSLLKHLKIIMYHCHVQLPHTWITLQQLTFVGTAHSVMTHSKMIQVEGKDELVPSCVVSFIYNGKLFYVTTWGCMTCTSLYFCTYNWARRVQVFYESNVHQELFTQMTCSHCCPHCTRHV